MVEVLVRCRRTLQQKSGVSLFCSLVDIRSETLFVEPQEANSVGDRAIVPGRTHEPISP